MLLHEESLNLHKCQPRLSQPWLIFFIFASVTKYYDGMNRPFVYGYLAENENKLGFSRYEVRDTRIVKNKKRKVCEVISYLVPRTSKKPRTSHLDSFQVIFNDYIIGKNRGEK